MGPLAERQIQVCDLDVQMHPGLAPDSQGAADPLGQELGQTAALLHVVGTRIQKELILPVHQHDLPELDRPAPTLDLQDLETDDRLLAIGVADRTTDQPVADLDEPVPNPEGPTSPNQQGQAGGNQQQAEGCALAPIPQRGVQDPALGTDSTAESPRRPR